MCRQIDMTSLCSILYLGIQLSAIADGVYAPNSRAIEPCGAVSLICRCSTTRFVLADEPSKRLGFNISQAFTLAFKRSTVHVICLHEPVSLELQTAGLTKTP